MENSHEEDMDIFDDGFISEDDYEVENIINEMFGSEEEDDVDLEPEEDSSEVNSTDMWNATRVFCLPIKWSIYGHQHTSHFAIRDWGFKRSWKP